MSTLLEGTWTILKMSSGIDKLFRLIEYFLLLLLPFLHSHGF